MPNSKQLFKLFILIIACLLIAYSAVMILLGNATLDIALYYTYFVFSPSFVIVGGTLLLFFLSTLLLAGYHRFARRWWNVLSISSAIILFIFIYRLL